MIFTEINDKITIRKIQNGITIGKLDIYHIKDGHHLMSGLIVEPDFRRQGVATELVNESKRHADKITIFCYQRDSLINMYGKCGFEIVKLEYDIPLNIIQPNITDTETGLSQIRMEWNKK